MRLALHPAVVGDDIGLLADYCRYMGVRDLFYQLHDVPGYNNGALSDPDKLMKLQDSFMDAGLRISAINDFLPSDPASIEARARNLRGTIELLGKAEIGTLILFVLQEESDEVRVSLERLYKEIVTKAQAHGVRIATHGHWCPGHIAYNKETVTKLIEIAPQPANGVCLCAGCYYQAGDDPAELIRSMPERIHCVHIRDTSLMGGCDLEELPLGVGRVPIVDVMKALRDIDYQGLVIPEHLSMVSAQANMEVTHAHAVGYLQGILSSIN